MTKTIAIMALLTAGTLAKAETFTCSFTEPFLTVTYSTDSQVLKEKDDGTGKTRALRGVSFQIAGAGQFLLKDARGAEIARLELTGKGSDGMSERIYPYDITYKKLSGVANNGMGGCSSTLLPSKEGQN